MNTFLLRNTATRNLLLLIAIGTTMAVAAAGVKVGDLFPELAAQKLEGKLPDSLKGKVILVDFWASWCVPCAKSFPIMEELQQRYKQRGFSVIAVSVDEKQADMASFLKKHAASFPVVRDAEHKLVAALDVSAMPTSFLVDSQGKIRFIHSGFFGEQTRKQYAEEIESLLKSTAAP